MAGINSFRITAIAALIIAILFNPLRNSVQRLVDKRFYKRSYDYYSTIQQVSSTLASMFNKNNISKFIGNIIMEVLGLERVYMMSSVPAEGSFEINYKSSKDSGSKYSVTDEGIDRLNIFERAELIKFYDTSREIIIKDELPLLKDRVGRDVTEEIKEEMEKFKGEVLVPVFVDGNLSVLIILGEKLSGDMFTNEDLNMLSTISDQTAIALKNAQLYAGRIQTERLASIGMMSATFAHEIRNPLTSLKTFAQLMPEKYSDPEFRGTFSKIVEGEIEKIDTLIGDLLDFSSDKKTGRVNTYNIVELVDETVEYIKGKFDPVKRDIEVEKKYEEKNIQMFGDTNKLKQAFGIIITNGYQAMNGNGKLTIDIKKNAGNVEVAISDTGEGILHEDISRIFDPFVTTKEMGVGLGLAISKRVVEDHEGRIHVNSKLSEGSTFTISLPVKK
jgi:signal transduction histidine kinase